MRRVLLISGICMFAGCVIRQYNPPPEVAARRAAREAIEAESAPIADVILTESSQFSEHVGEIVTIKGVQSRSKIPQVLGVDVRGNYGLSEQTVYATGLLDSYVVTEEQVAASCASDRIAATRSLVAGTFYTLQEPQTREPAKTYLWKNP